MENAAGRLDTGNAVTWWAKGLLFENCNCQLVCPGHVHFDQLCTHERCKGYWAIRFGDGQFGQVPLRGASAVKAYDTPRHMIDGNWTEVLIIDEALAGPAREAVERILTGAAGGPWAKLAKFVGKRLPTRFLPIRFEEAGPTRRIGIEGVLEAEITDIRGRDRGQAVTFRNMFNQIHAPDQVLALGSTRYDDGVIVVNTHGTHGLHSTFDWAVTAT
jgi:hypothetical protein